MKGFFEDLLELLELMVFDKLVLEFIFHLIHLLRILESYFFGLVLIKYLLLFEFSLVNVVFGFYDLNLCSTWGEFLIIFYELFVFNQENLLYFVDFHVLIVDEFCLLL